LLVSPQPSFADVRTEKAFSLTGPEHDGAADEIVREMAMA
jgi:hypothetical protein